LIVIIENKLKSKFEKEEDSWFVSLSDKNKRFVNISKLFNRAKEIGFFDELHFSIATAAVNIRHGESHQEGFKDEKTRVQLSMLGTIEIIGNLVPTTKVINSVKSDQTKLT
jgi:hypothetical protein